MHVDDCYQLGYIVKPHGLKGEVQIYIESDEPQAYQNLESVFVQQGQQLVPFFIESISMRSEKAIVAFEDIHRVEEAAPLKGLKLFLPLDFLPELEDDKYYLHELEGFEVFDASNDQSIGVIKGLIEMGPQLTLMVEHVSGKEVLVPFSEELQVSLNKDKKIMSVTVADGLLDLYLSNED